jgi:hypothetical protein
MKWREGYSRGWTARKRWRFASAVARSLRRPGIVDLNQIPLGGDGMIVDERFKEGEKK